MKIAIITERANISLGGAERSVFELAARLVLLGSDVKILTATGAGSCKRVKILCSDRKKRVSFKAFKAAAKEHLQNNHYDIVHSMLPMEFADVYQPRGGSFPEAAFRNAVSYSNAITRTFKLLTGFANFRRTMLARAEKKLCKSPNPPVVAALSEYVKRQFIKYYQLPEEKIAVIPNGVRLPAAAGKTKTDKLYSQILKKLNIKQADEPVIFLFAAHNFRLKGLQTLTKAMAIAQNKYTKRPPYLIIAGRGASIKYRHLAAKYGIKKNILFLGAVGSVRNLLAVSDVAVLPSFYDPASRFILEALAAGRPVITTKFNGAVDSFVPDVHGKVFDSPNDLDSLAEAIRFYCNSDNLKNAQVAIKQDDIRTKVSIETHCRKLLELYQNIINNRKNQ